MYIIRNGVSFHCIKFLEIYVGFSLGFRARDDSLLEFAIVMFKKDCIYTNKYIFTKFSE